MAFQKKTKQLLSLLLTLAISISLIVPTLTWGNTVYAEDGTINYLADEIIAPGIRYTEEDHLDFQNTGRRTRINRMVIDPSGKDLHIISSKAGDTVNAMESIETQANRERAKGNNVVATINAGTFDMYTANGGIPTGLMIQNGAVITSQPNDFYNGQNVSCFYTTDNDTFNIAHLLVRGSIKVGEGFEKDVNLINRTNFYNRFAGPTRSYETYRVFTSAVNKTHTMELNSPDATVADPQLPIEESYALIEVNEFNGSIYPGETYTGQVSKVYTTQGFTIPENCIVLAGFNNDAGSVAALKEGDTVSYECRLYTGEWTGGFNYGTGMAEGKAEDVGEVKELTNVRSANSAFQDLAKDGVSLIDQNSNYDGLNARTLLGIAEDGKLQVATINESGMMEKSLTDGATFQEMVPYMVDTLGCKDVINLDSGGSAEMAVRRAGADKVTQASYPSDGGSRSVTDAIMFVSNSERTSEIGSVIVDKDINIYLGSAYKFSVRLTDTNNNALTLSDQTLVWSAEKGTIDSQGNYTAPAEVCSDIVTATVDGSFTGKAKVQVVDSTAVISISMTPDGSLALDQGDTKQFSLSAFNSDKQQVVISNDKAEWSVTDGVGTVKDGLLIVTAAQGTGSIGATIFEKTLKTDMIIGIKEQIIENFDHAAVEGFRVQRVNDGSTNYYGGAASASELIGLNNDELGDRSLSINYMQVSSYSNMNIWFRFNEADDKAGNGIWNEELRSAMDERYTAKAMPKRIGMMVYGDNSGNRLWVGVTAGYGTSSPQNMSNLGGVTINWTGWKWVEMPISQMYAMPIHLRYLWIQRSNNTNEKTTVRFDDIKFLYTDDGVDLGGPEFSEITPAAGNIYSDVLNFSTAIIDAKSAVDASSIKVAVNGEAINDYTFDAAKGILSFTKTGLENGQDYTVTVSASDTLGNPSNPTLSVTYHVDTAPDKEAPVISTVTPRQGVFPVQVPRPRINFRLKDAKNAVEEKSIILKLNGQDLPVYFDKNTGFAYSQPDFDLPAGVSVFTIDAADTAGNAMSTYNGSFTVDPIGQPVDPNQYTVAVIPDTQGNTFSQKIYGRAAEDGSDFVIQMGDIVDVKDQSDYDAAIDDIHMLGGKHAIVIGGNHEGLNTEAYYNTFSTPTYYFQYGNALYIVLNSMLGQSVSYTDSTQYHWLEEVLKDNTLPNVYVLNHVVTRDDYLTDHNMSDAEANVFEGILSNYKTANPKHNITVLFGHLHTLHTWQVGGVDYIITGNAANKGYVTNDQGNFLGSGTITMKDGKSDFSFNPLLTKIYIKNSALYGDTLRTVSGAKLKLDVYGDFREYPANYLTEISDDSLVKITWTSSEPSVATVDHTGVVEILSEGKATITASCGGKTNKVLLDAGKLDDTKLIKLTLTLPNKIIAGYSYVPSVLATDVNGNNVLMDNTKIKFTSQKGLLRTQEQNRLYAAAAGTDTVTAQYTTSGGKTLTTTAVANIENPSSSPSSGRRNSSDAAVPAVPAGTTVVKNPDGSITTTTLGNDGSKIETIQAVSGETTATVTLPKNGGKNLVSIPIKNPGPGTVAIIIHDDGREEVVKKSAFEGNNLLLFLNDSAKLRIVERNMEFSDIDSSQWYYDAVSFIAARDLLKGTSEDLFGPGETMTRAMLLTAFYRLDNGTESVASENWYSSALKWSMENNISDGSAPNDPITRQQMVAILYRYSQTMGLPTGGNAKLDAYSDAESVADYGREAMVWAVSNGIISGIGDGRLDPGGSATRSQVAAILMRFEEFLMKAS